MIISEININPELRATIWPLKPEEKAALEESILSEGCRDPLVLWNNTILDGHNRHEICTRLKIPFKTTTVKLTDILDAKLWIRMNQISRRNLADDQRAMNAAFITELKSAIALRERAKAGREAGGKATPEQKADRLSVKTTDKRSKPKRPKKDTRKEVSKAAKVSERKLRAALKIKKEDPKLAEKILAGEITIRDAKKVLEERERATRRAR